MKIKKMYGCIILIAVMVLLVSCQQLVGTINDPKAIVGGSKVTIVIPRVNPLIQGAKGFAFVDSVELDFYQGDELVKAVFLDNAYYDPDTNTIRGSVSILAGTYDKLIVSVFNHAVSNSVPVVSGWITEPFTVDEGEEISFNLPLYPYEPTMLSAGSMVDVPSLALNGEKWYAFFAPAEKTRVVLQATEGSLDAYIFGPDAYPLQDISGDETTVLFDTPDPDNLYYICVVSRENGSVGKVGFFDPRGLVNISFY